jgi:hypothetical protein
MKKTLCITALCAITALFSGCWKKKENTNTISSAVSTDANDAIMSDEKPIKVAALTEISPEISSTIIGAKSTEPSNGNKIGDHTNDEQPSTSVKKDDPLESDRPSVKDSKSEKESKKESQKENADNEDEKEEKSNDDTDADIEADNENENDADEKKNN